MKKSKTLVAACLALMTIGASAQNIQVNAQLDSTIIAIGSQVGMTVSASFPSSSGATLRQLTDTLSAEVEIIEAQKPDTSFVGDMTTLVQRYIVTSFDTGLHYVPPIEFLVLPDGSTVVNDDALLLDVRNPFNIEYDEQSGVAKITDIKDALDAPFVWSELLEYWPWLVLIVVVAGLVVLGVWLYRRYKRKQLGIVPKKKVPQEPSHVIAMRELNRIREEKLWQRNLFKEYYSDLTDTLRRYVSNRFGINAMESTTDEIVENIFPVLDGDIVNKNRLQDVLTLADLVKFAKSEPLPDENDMALKKAMDFVTGTIPAEPAVKKEEEEDNA